MNAIIFGTMERVIWKYPISAQDEFVLEMPEGRPEILDAQVQNGEVVLWASVDPTQRLTPHKFRVVPTGAPYNPDGLTYIATFQPTQGLVFHLFSVR